MNVTEHICCATDCIFEEAKILNSTGFIDINRFGTLLTEKSLKNVFWYDNINQTVEICSTEGKGTVFIKKI
jgi:hypothetical protein